jgi:hypothetical protein
MSCTGAKADLISTELNRIKPISTDFNLLFKKIMKTHICVRPAAFVQLRRARPAARASTCGAGCKMREATGFRAMKRRKESVGLKVKEMAKENKSVGAGKKF